MTKRYLLIPGDVKSSADSDWHYVSASRLAYLYKVSMSECIVIPEIDHGALGGGRERSELLCKADRGELIVLRPKSNGDYSIPRSNGRGGAV